MPAGDGNRINWSDFVPDDELREMYKTMSIEKMAMELGVDRKVLSRKLYSIGVKVRVPGRLRHINRLYEVFMATPELMATREKELSCKYGCSVPSVRVAKAKARRTLAMFRG